MTKIIISGTVDLPPEQCPYPSPNGIVITEGLGYRDLLIFCRIREGFHPSIPA